MQCAWDISKINGAHFGRSATSVFIVIFRWCGCFLHHLWTASCLSGAHPSPLCRSELKSQAQQVLLFQIPGDLPRARDFSRWGSHTPLSHLQTAKLGALEQRWVSELAQHWPQLKLLRCHDWWLMCLMSPGLDASLFIIFRRLDYISSNMLHNLYICIYIYIRPWLYVN